MNRKAQFNRILIIQSLEVGLTGKRLYEDLNTLTLCKDHVVRVELCDVASKQDLLSLLDSIPTRMAAEDILPILHFEVHGSSKRDGIVLSSGDLVSWADLRAPMTAINIASQFNLIVCFAACHGAGFVSTLTPKARSPCWAMLGPKEEVDDGVMLVDFTEMYKCILDGGTGDEAVDILNRSLPVGQAPYMFTTAEVFFEWSWNVYCEKRCTYEGRKDLTKEVIKELRRNNRSDRIPQRNDLMKQFSERVLPEVKNRSLELFFMADLFPANSERFSLDKNRLLCAAER